MEYDEAFYVRKGFLMPKGWKSGDPVPTKRAKTIDKPIKVLGEFYYQPEDSMDTIAREDIPHYEKQHGNLQLYQDKAERIWEEQREKEGATQVKKSDFEQDGADLMVIWVWAGCGGGVAKSGSYLIGDPCII